MISRPAKTIRPPRGRSIPAMARISDDLPAPTKEIFLRFFAFARYDDSTPKHQSKVSSPR
jgi:hypothetical protein